MYGLPANFDATVFLGKELELVCFSENTISLTFGGDVSITILGTFSYQIGPSDKATACSVPVSTSNLMCLIGKEVCRVEKRDDGTLVLQFANQHVLALLDDSRDYEAYTIRIGKREIIV